MFAFALWDERREVGCSARATGSASSRSTTRRRRPLCFASEAKALLPFLPEIATDPRGAGRVSDLPIHDRRGHPVPRRQAAAARSCADRRERRGAGHGATGTSATKSISTTPRVFRTARLDCSTIHCACICAATCRSAPMFRAASIRAQYRDPCRHNRARHRLLSTAASPSFPAMTRAITPQPRRQAVRPLHTSTSPPSISATTIADVLYHLDFPVAGPGSFPQFMVSQLAASHT